MTPYHDPMHRPLAPLAFALSMLAPAALADEPPFVDLSFEQALDRARETDRALFIDFFTTWCGPCKRLDKETWTDETVRAWLGDRTVPIKIDAEAQEQLADRYEVKGYPTLIFIDGEGEEIERLIGFLPPGEFLEQAGIVLDAGSTSELIDRRREIAHDSGAPARLEFAKLLIRHERYDEALEELNWCYDVGMGERSIFRGARNTRVMTVFEDLADNYEPAREELDRRAVALLRKAVAGRASASELHDLSAINRAIGREGRTRELIGIIEERAPGSSALDALYRLNRADLLETGWYARLAVHFPPRDALVQSHTGWPRTEARIGRMPDADRAGALESALRREVGRLAEATEIALGSSDAGLAGKLESRAMELAPSDWFTHHAIAGAYRRATDDAETALDRARRAVGLLREDEEAETVAPIVRLAEILDELGRGAEALELLRSTLDTTADAELREALEESIDSIGTGEPRD